MPYRALIIDDEHPAREIIRSYLQDHPEIEISGEYADGFSGLKAIQERKPDLIFLDIQMPKLSGFELLELVESPPVIIFSTAFDQYAIRAFEHNAVDYLLKPYSRERFRQAVEKALASLRHGGTSRLQVKAVLREKEEQQEILNRIAVRIHHKVFVIPVSGIICLEADGDYVTIHTGEGKYLKEKTMRFFERHLDPARFVRIHRSHIINLDFIDKIEYYDRESYVVKMKNGMSLRASTAGYRALKEKLKM